MTSILLLALALAEPVTVQSAYPPPDGYTRVEADAFGAWLRERPLKPADQPIRTHAGAKVGHDGRVVDLPLVPGDLQQCADSAIRLRAEWLRETNEPVSFHATSGDPLPWSRFEAGEQPYVVDDRIQWKRGASGTWEDYLVKVFTWAGSASLEERDTTRITAPKPGALLVQGGFPGHVVVLLDVAKKGDQTVILVGEGFMPAQDFHVETGPERGWWPWDGTLDLGHWAFTSEHLRSFE